MQRPAETTGPRRSDSPMWEIQTLGQVLEHLRERIVAAHAPAPATMTAAQLCEALDVWQGDEGVWLVQDLDGSVYELDDVEPEQALLPLVADGPEPEPKCWTLDGRPIVGGIVLDVEQDDERHLCNVVEQPRRRGKR